MILNRWLHIRPKEPDQAAFKLYPLSSIIRPVSRFFQLALPMLLHSKEDMDEVETDAAEPSQTTWEGNSTVEEEAGEPSDVADGAKQNLMEMAGHQGLLWKRNAIQGS